MWKEIHWFIFIMGLFLKCDAVKFPIDRRYETYTAGGNLYVKVANPAFFIIMPSTLDLNDHCWMTRNDVAKDAQIVPLPKEAKDMIVELVNIRRAKLMLGAYFDEDRPADWGVLPPAVNLRKAVWDEDLAQKITTPYTKKFIFEHNVHNQYGIYPKIGENIFMQTGIRYKEDPDELRKFLKMAFEIWFEGEMPYYKHFNSYNTQILDYLLQKTFKGPLVRDRTINEEKKGNLLHRMQYGHMTALTVQNIASVGCAVAVRPTHRTEPGAKGYFDRILFCNFGGDIPTNVIGGKGEPLYPIDEPFLEEHGIPQSTYDIPAV